MPASSPLLTNQPLPTILTGLTEEGKIGMIMPPHRGAVNVNCEELRYFSENNIETHPPQRKLIILYSVPGLDGV